MELIEVNSIPLAQTLAACFEKGQKLPPDEKIFWHKTFCLFVNINVFVLLEKISVVHPVVESLIMVLGSLLLF